MRPRTSCALKGSRLVMIAASSRESYALFCTQFMRHPRPGRLADACAVVRKFRQIRTTDRSLAMKKPRPRKKSDSESFAEGVGRGLRMAARSARRTARMYGTPIYVWENGKVVAKKP